MAGRRAKRLLRFLLWIFLLVLIVAISSPLWFPWLLRPTAKRFGAAFQSYQRLGYTGFTLTDVSYTNRNVTVHAAHLELDPWRGHAKAKGWSVLVVPSDQPSTNAPPSVHRVYQNVSKIVSNVQRWIPEASLSDGYVETPNVTIGLPSVRWDGPRLFGQVQISNALPLTTVAAEIPTVGPVHVALTNPSRELRSSATISNTPEGISVRMANVWRTNQFDIVAKFGRSGALPETAVVSARSVVFPPFSGDVSFVWQENRYALSAQGVVAQQPIAFKLQAAGETNFARIESAEVIGPWAQAKLNGQISFDPALNVAEFSLSGDNIQLAHSRASQMRITGMLFRSNLVHAGSILVRNVSAHPIKPFDLALSWSGEKLDLHNIDAAATAGPSAVSLSAAADFKARHFQISRLTVGTHQLDISADLRWPEAANVCARVTNLVAESISGFVDLPHEDAVLNHLRLAAGWDHGPLTGDMDFAGHGRLMDGTVVGAKGALAARGQGLTITNLSVTRNGEPVSVAEGFIPVCLDAAQSPFAIPVPGEVLQVQVTAHRNAFFWKTLEDRFGVALREPDLRAYLSGTWDKPTGRLSLRAAAVKFRNAPPAVPPLEGVALMAHIRKETAEVEFLNFFVTNQPITFAGTMPLPQTFWSAPQTNLANLDWRNLSCRLKIDNAQIAGFAPLLSGILVPQGIIDADLGLLPGGKLDGQLRIDGAGTRPIAALGALQDIEILCRFAGDKARINSYVALGGYSVLGGGEVQIDPNQLLRRELPPFEFTLTGENVPLTRQPDAIVRADLDVTAKHTAATWPVALSGKLNLRNSLYLRELRELVPGKLASVDRRPPYFSVTAKPFADWRLDLHAAGHRFLKVRTPVFNGEASADFKLSGTLGSPVAIGDVSIDSGAVRFPFGIIPVKQGIISLTSDNPYRPQLLINGSDRVLGYDINMELRGFADAPVLQFNSTPPLNSDQILLMLTAGEIPRQGQFAFTPEQRAQRLAFFVGRGMLSDLGIGGDSNRLTVRSGENVTETGRPTYSVEYELTHDWSVIGQYDRFNDFNLMLKYRVYSK